MPPEPSPITDPKAAEEVARAIAACGRFALDLEFVSEDRYIPELALVQVSWGDDPDAPTVAALDPLEVDVAPLAELVADPAIRTVLHSAQGDLSLLARRFGIRGRAIFDTQVAAGFLGIGDQIGYARLVEEILGKELDKAMQFTKWLRRPLTAEQVAYALDDVRYLPRLTVELGRGLMERGRFTWVEEESDRVAEVASQLPAPEEAYRKIGSWRRMKPNQLGALRALAEWRERRALSANRPPSWILKNGVLQELAMRQPKDPEALKRIEGLSPATRKRHGQRFLKLIADGSTSRPPRSEGGRSSSRLSSAGKKLASQLSSLVQERSREADIAPRFVANRSDCDALARWWTEDDRSREPDLPLLHGWRRELVGDAVLATLAGHEG